MKARFIILWGKPLDAEAFDEHYHKTHIPLAKRMSRLKHYTISRNISVIRGDEPYYLVAELEWDSMDDLREDFNSIEGRATGEDVNVLSQWNSDIRSMIYAIEEV